MLANLSAHFFLGYMNQYVIAIIGFLSFGIFLVTLEILSRRYKLSSEWVRRISHIFASLFTIYFSFHLESFFLLTTLAIFSIVMLTSRILKIFNHIHAVSRKTFGEELLPIGFIAAYLISRGQIEIFIPSILVIGFADPITGMVMQKWKKNSLGILTFVVITIPLILLFAHTSLMTTFIIAVCVAIIERVSPYGTDNLSIPTTMALLLSSINI